ncbi:MAG: HDOD domain-containing protein [Pseudomonadota bacterium]
MDKMSKVRKIVQGVDKLPALPGVVSQVLELTANPDFSTTELVAVVSLDPGVTANVLRRANSAYFGLGRKVATLDQALTRIGVENLVDITLNSGVMPMFDKFLAGYEAKPEQLWRHCLATALVARRLAQIKSCPTPGEVYTAGLLHDVGKLILSTFLAEELAQIVDLVVNKSWPAAEAEREVLGVDHAVLGGLAARRWHLNESIQGGIFFHHQPQKASPNRLYANLVALANYMVINCGMGCGFDESHISLPTTVLFDLALTPALLDQMQAEAQKILEKAEPLFSLVQA